MIAEGRGRVPPAPVVVEVGDLDRFRMERLAVERSRKYAARGDAWGRGIRPDAILTGLLSEQATVDLLRRRLPGLRVAWEPELIPQGDDGCDVEVCGLRIQVKGTARAAASTSHFYFRRQDARGRLLPLRFDLAVCCACPPSTGRRAVAVLGWAMRGALRESPFRRSPVGGLTHMNLRLAVEDLEPVSELIDWATVRADEARGG